MKVQTLIVSVLLCIAATGQAHAAEVYDPGRFAIDGFRVECGGLPTVLTTDIRDVAMTDGRAILMNPAILERLPTPLKLYVFAHECGHTMAGGDEFGADCIAVRTGRGRGWLPRQAFGHLVHLLRENPRRPAAPFA